MRLLDTQIDLKYIQRNKMDPLAKDLRSDRLKEKFYV